MIDKEKLDRIHKELPADFYDCGIQKNFFQRVWHLQRFQIIRQVIKNIDLKQEDIVLDLGCNAGYLSKIIADITNTNVIGVDISEKAINRAKSNYPNLNFRTIDISIGLPFPDNYFQVITAFDVLEHIIDLDKVMQDIKRVLHPSGYLIIGLPNENLFFSLIWYIWLNLKGRVLKGVHIRNYKLKDFITLFKAVGFKKVSQKRSHLGLWYLFVFQLKKV